jgi:hypothetical protein
MIPKKLLADYYTTDEKAVFGNQARLQAALKRHQSGLAEIDAKIAGQRESNMIPEDEIENLINGVRVERPPTLGAQRTAIQYDIRDVETALDFMAGKI